MEQPPSLRGVSASSETHRERSPRSSPTVEGNDGSDRDPRFQTLGGKPDPVRDRSRSRKEQAHQRDNPRATSSLAIGMHHEEESHARAERHGANEKADARVAGRMVGEVQERRHGGERDHSRYRERQAVVIRAFGYERDAGCVRQQDLPAVPAGVDRRTVLAARGRAPIRMQTRTRRDCFTASPPSLPPPSGSAGGTSRPLPGTLSTETVPPCASTTCRTRYSPSPGPPKFAAGAARSNRVKIRA